ncbi:uncharacterized protein LOC122822612 isoform X2 [Gambusia affinis]|uniref:uncharacterized protein LOC122822612 isoform X2 n=1 Tax=Gambusia affinis TaxID=33528 RepID=UPI001CDCE591|nr:uncharacterized protein LOC122822612 isoform X2 [Gambusia affinis]
MPRGSEIPEGIRSTAVDLHKAGKGYKFISKTLEIPPSTVRSIIVKWKRFNTVATLPRSGRPSKGNPRRKRKEKLDEADPAGPASEKGGDPDKPDLLSKVLFAAGNTDSNSTDSKPSKEELASSRPTLHSRDKEMRDLNSSCEEGDNTGRSDSDEEDPMSSFLFARSTGEAEDHERVDHPGRACDTEDPDESQKDESTVEEDGDAEPSDTDEEDPLASYLSGRAREGTEEHPQHEKRKHSASCDDTPEDDPMVTFNMADALTYRSNGPTRSMRRLHIHVYGLINRSIIDHLAAFKERQAHVSLSQVLNDYCTTCMYLCKYGACFSFPFLQELVKRL